MHGFYASSHESIGGRLEDCRDMDVVVLTAGANPKPGQTRLDLLEEAESITRDIVSRIVGGGFDGVFVVAANPVDIVTYIVREVSGFPRNRVIGTGTSIDSARLKTLLSEVFSIDPRSVNGYAMGEHGESQFVAWSHVTIGGKPLLHIWSSIRNDSVTLTWTKSHKRPKMRVGRFLREKGTPNSASAMHWLISCAPS
ncbi:hypothetical protein HMSSN139_17230 [Paenibacillus sp. HMSSN-139]|nr:hypothetical protein HMSSN139_17230 [Paenibacillus sp. HMSSN-139]